MMVVLQRQDPFLFSTTIRDNLDPHKTHSDKEIWASSLCIVQSMCPELGHGVFLASFQCTA